MTPLRTPLLAPDLGPSDGSSLLSPTEASGPSEGSASSPETTLDDSPETETSGYVDASGVFTEGWLDRLPEDLAGAKDSLGKFKTLPDALKSYHNLQQILGKKAAAVLVPGEKSTADEIAAFRKAVGAPDNEDGYKLRPEKLPEGMEWHEELAKPFQTWAHKYHLPQAAMQELVSLHLSQRQGESAQIAGLVEARREEGVRTLRSAWGESYDKNLTLAGRAARLAGVDPQSPGFGDPEVVKAIVQLGTMLSEDKLSGPLSGATLQPGRQRAMDIMSNPQNPLHAKYQAGDQETAALVTNLLKNG